MVVLPKLTSVTASTSKDCLKESLPWTLDRCYEETRHSSRIQQSSGQAVSKVGPWPVGMSTPTGPFLQLVYVHGKLKGYISSIAYHVRHKLVSV